MQYGMTQLALIHSGTYACGVIPLTDSVSFFGANNRGKSTAINALQLFFIPNMQGAKFENYSKDDTRRFYFPDEASYILVEIVSPVGTYVLGIVGKGAISAYAYQHFLYAGQLDVNDFIIKGNKRRKFKQFTQHMQDKGIEVSSLAPREVEQLMCGSNNRFNLDLGLVPVGGIERYRHFKSLFVSLISREHINATRIKNALIDVFSKELNTYHVVSGSINFEQKRAEAFAEYEQLQLEYQKLLSVGEQIERLQQCCIERNAQLGQLRQMEPVLLTRYQHYQQQTEQQINALAQVLAGAEQQQQNLLQQMKQCELQLTPLHQQQGRLSDRIVQFQQKQQQLSLASEATLRHNVTQLQQQYDNLTAQVAAKSGLDRSQLKREQQRLVVQLAQLNKTLAADETLGSWLAKQFEPAQLALFYQLFQADLLHSPLGDAQPLQIEDSTALQHLLQQILHGQQGTQWQGAGLTIQLDQLETPQVPDYVDQKAELTQQQAEVEQRLAQLAQQLEAIEQHEELSAQKAACDEELRQAIRGLDDWISHQQQQDEYENWLEQQAELQVTIEQCQQQKQDLEQQREQIIREFSDQRDRLTELTQQQSQYQTLYQRVKPLDKAWPQGDICTQDYQDCALEELLTTYLKAYAQLEQTLQQLDKTYQAIGSAGYRGAESAETLEERYQHLIEAWEARAQTEDMLKNKRYAAITSLGSLLADFLNDFYTLESKLKHLNHEISKRKVSNLQAFRIELLPNQQLIEAIQTIVKTGTIIEQGQTLALNFDEEVDDQQAAQSAAFVGERVAAQSNQGHLHLADLFNVGFIVVDQQGSTHRYDEIDEAGSTGTRSTLKIITLMYLIRYMMEIRHTAQQRLLFTVDEIANVDSENARQLLETAQNLGFIPLLTSVYPLDLATYGIDVERADTQCGRIQSLSVEQRDWWVIEAVS